MMFVLTHSAVPHGTSGREGPPHSPCLDTSAGTQTPPRSNCNNNNTLHQQCAPDTVSANSLLSGGLNFGCQIFMHYSTTVRIKSKGIQQKSHLSILGLLCLIEPKLIVHNDGLIICDCTEVVMNGDHLEMLNITCIMAKQFTK